MKPGCNFITKICDYITDKMFVRVGAYWALRDGVRTSRTKHLVWREWRFSADFEGVQTSPDVALVRKRQKGGAGQTRHIP